MSAVRVNEFPWQRINCRLGLHGWSLKQVRSEGFAQFKFNKRAMSSICMTLRVALQLRSDESHIALSGIKKSSFVHMSDKCCDDQASGNQVPRC